jgi:phytoene dehydrogenase-like protein
MAYDAVVVGGGHNGLVTASYLAKAGLQTLVLERRDRVGGPLASEELVADLVGRLRADVVGDLRLASHGFKGIEPEVVAFAPSVDGPGLTRCGGTPVRTATELRERPQPRVDAEAFLAFDRKRSARWPGFVVPHAEAEPPDPHPARPSDAGTGFTLSNALRHLGGEETREALRVMPMSVADLVSEAVEDEALREPRRRGVRYSPRARSAGTG